METEASAEYNSGISSIVTDLYRLRTIECSPQTSLDVKYSKASPLLKRVTEKLRRRENYVAFRPMWEELHDRMVYYYAYLNQRNLSKSMPLFRETLHNEVVKWWLECKRMGKLAKTLLHFDTHDDMGLPSTSKYLLRGGTLYEEGVMSGSCGQISWPVTCILLSGWVNHVIWCTPKWIYDDDITVEQSLVCTKGDEFMYVRGSGEPKDKFMLEDDIVISDDKLQSTKFQHPHRFDRVKSHTLRGWTKLSKGVQGRKFILDIDLDFFVTNGDKISLKDYMKNFNDIESTGRVHGLPGVVTPRETYNDPMSRDIVKDLNKEVSLIEKRVSKFLDGLSSMKDKGKLPSCISLSDSAPSFMSGDVSRAVFTNQYTPKYYVPLLHVLLLTGLRELYGGVFK